VIPTVVVGTTPDEEDEEAQQPKGDAPLTKAIELLKAKSS
jgi:hypothetical protein